MTKLRQLSLDLNPPEQPSELLVIGQELLPALERLKAEGAVVEAIDWERTLGNAAYRFHLL